MRFEHLKTNFLRVVAPSLPNDWEIEDVLLHLERLPDEVVEAVLVQVGVIWPVSHSLCFAYLSDGGKGFEVIPLKLYPEWSRRILELYETSGLVVARKFIVEPETQFLARRQGLYGVGFADIAPTMQHYINGISGRSIRLVSGSQSGTDTGKITVPEMLDVFATQVENSLLYKLIIALQLGHIGLRHYEEIVDHSRNNGIPIPDILLAYEDSALARDLILVIWLIRSFQLIRHDYPGLARAAAPLCREMIDNIGPAGDTGLRSGFIRGLLLFSLCGEEGERWDDFGLPLLSTPQNLCDLPVLASLPSLYGYVQDLSGPCDLTAVSYLLGGFEIELAASEIKKRREDQKNSFIALLALNMSRRPENSHEERENNDAGDQVSDTALLVLPDSEWDQEGEIGKSDYLLENGEGDLSDELKALAAAITEDLGELPEAYVQAATGMAGFGVNNRDSGSQPEEDLRIAGGGEGFSYDEWDFRRGGYRKGWCTLYEKDIHPVKSTLIEETLAKYHGQLHKIRRQFEMLRTRKRFVRRRRHGDDIDFDALVDGFGDAKAGLVPSDRLFMRLLRDQREITSYFLVDMSNSTEGWVGTAVKESLILMSEAMEIVGDPYAIYGFSGMRRSKSEVYPIKEVRENYSETVRDRIAGITPKEYTRMGPPIRHMVRKLLESDTKVRLLIIFSDGKPEDYDDYKGRYAIEDTRKAILEAKGAGVHVFCVTIDKTAHDYLDHMCGGGQYVFVNDVNLLPARMVDLYRLLTR